MRISDWSSDVCSSDLANPQTRTFEARYVLEGRLADAPLGSTIVIQIPAIHIPRERSASALQVPIGALFDPGKGPGVWLVEGDAPRVTWRAVQVAGQIGMASCRGRVCQYCSIPVVAGSL